MPFTGIAGAHHVFLAERIGLALVFSGITGEQHAGAQLMPDLGKPAVTGSGADEIDPAHRDLRHHCLPLPLRGVAGIDVAQFVAEQARQFGLVVKVQPKCRASRPLPRRGRCRH